MADLFPTHPTEPRARLQPALARLATEGVYLGTSSWKYPGWCGLLYDEQRYVYRGKFATARFEQTCLAEYAQVFKTVCVDAAYYQFPSEKYLADLAAQVPADFRFTFKVTDDLTLKRFPNLPRFGARAGQPNPHFLDADLFQRAFLAPCATVRPLVGLLIFEFSRFYPADYEHGRDFTADLEAFLGKLPFGWRYGVELRNRHWLQPEYFAMLRRHGVAHVFNSWDAMPSVSEQLAMPGSETSDTFLAARFLLKPGRKYEEAVKEFSPYNAVKEVNSEARCAGAGLVHRARQKAKPAFIYVNNRLEGNALETIAALVEQADSGRA